MTLLRRTSTLCLLVFAVAIAVHGACQASPALTVSTSPVVPIDKAAAGQELHRTVLISNTDADDHQYQLTTVGLAETWGAAFTVDGKVTTELSIAGGAQREAELVLHVPGGTSAGTVRFAVLVTRDDGQSERVELAVGVTRDYKLKLANELQGVTAVSGQSLAIAFEVQNTGSKPLTQVRLALDLPKKWVASSVQPATVDLEPGATATLSVELLLPPGQASGNQTLGVAASSAQVTSGVTEVPIQVQRSPQALKWVGGFVVLLLGGTLLYFRKHGRR